MTVSILLIATKKYKEFVQPLLNSLDKYFLPDHTLNIHLFTDCLKKYEKPERIKRIYQRTIPSFGYPDATLLRYRTLTSINPKKYDEYLFYLDVDMKIVATVGDEILRDIIAVRHPGYFNQDHKNTWEERQESQCYTPQEKRKSYFAGGFQGGRTAVYFPIMKIMRGWIDLDLSKGIIPIFHDESAWNHFLAHCDSVTELNPSYCMPEPISKRIAWGINHIEPKILALEKAASIRL